MTPLTRWLTADDLMERWNRNIHELTEYVRNFKLPAYRGHELLDPSSVIRAIVDQCIFKLMDVKEFEDKYPELMWGDE